MRDNWKSMERNLPPKDGTFILAYTPEWNGNNSEESFDIVFWGDCCEGMSADPTNVAMTWCIKDSYNDERGGWMTADPTHWMHLESPHEEIRGFLPTCVQGKGRNQRS